jgi:hypothetical protein
MSKENNKFSYCIILLLLSNILFAGCGKKPGNIVVDPPVVVGNTTISYLEDQTDFSNPERGFYSEILSESSAPSSLTQAYLDQLKSKNITLIRRLYSMITFRSGPISAAYLQHIQDDMDMIRNNGFKIILRFSYTNNEPAPWDDAPLNIVSSHIDQLTNILQKNADVIAMMEAGFIGRWGEWHDSSNGLANPADMKTVLFKLLDALPKSRDVVVRYQQSKKDIFETNEPIGDADGFNKSNRSRTGHHNDCFLASDEDWGTYWPNDPASLEAQKNYLREENKYLPQQGETCNCNAPRSDCSAAVKELAQMRWSALNREYIECVLDSWKTQGCYDEISKRLGYRFRLLSAEIPKSVKIDAPLSLNLVLKNDGFASPYNARNMELVLRSKANAAVTRIRLFHDPRTWLPDSATIKITVDVIIPASLLPGEYDLLLNFPDPEITLNTKPAYSIRLANQNVWEATTGYNSLQAAVTIVK